jgi:tetratricopeptide (TPR) repeat protein
MMTTILVLAAAALAAVAVAGVVRPLGTRSAQDIELPDPLEEERSGLVRALRDLDREHESGLLSEADYRALRSETQARAVAVLRALEARDGHGELATEIRELRATSPPSRAGGKRRIVLGAAAGAALVVLVVLLAAGALRPRSMEEPITGVQLGDPIAFFQDRVRQHPADVAARLDLADRYLQVGKVEEAIAQYLSALKIDPDNPEARATLGFLLYQAGKAQDGLTQVNRALEIAPRDPEALYFKGLILLKGLHRPEEAAQAFQDYLGAAPFGARRAEVEQLLAEAKGQPGGT